MKLNLPSAGQDNYGQETAQEFSVFSHLRSPCKIWLVPAWVRALHSYGLMKTAMAMRSICSFTLGVLLVTQACLSNARADESSSSKFKSPYVSSPLRTRVESKDLEQEAKKPLPKIDQTKWDKLFFDSKTQQKLNVKGLDPKALGQGAWGSGDGALKADGSLVLYDLAESQQAIPRCKALATLIPKSSALEDLGFDQFSGRDQFPPYVRAQALIAKWQEVQTTENSLLTQLARSMKEVNFIWVEANSLPAAKRLKTLEGFVQSLTVISYIDPIGIVASRALWNRLDGCSQTGLMLHEAFRQLKAVEEIEYPDERIREIVRTLMLESPRPLETSLTSLNSKLETARTKFFEISIHSAKEMAKDIPVSYDRLIQDPDSQAEVKNLRSEDPTLLARYLKDPGLLAAMAEGLLVSSANYCNTLSGAGQVRPDIDCLLMIKSLSLTRDSATYEMLQKGFANLTSVFSGLHKTIRTFPLGDLLDLYLEVLSGRASAKEKLGMKKLVAALSKAASAQDGSSLFAIYVTQIAAKNSEK